MGKQRKTWSTDVKEAIVLSVLRGDVGVAEAARQHGVNECVCSPIRATHAQLTWPPALS